MQTRLRSGYSIFVSFGLVSVCVSCRCVQQFSVLGAGIDPTCRYQLLFLALMRKYCYFGVLLLSSKYTIKLHYCQIHIHNIVWT